MKAKWTLAAVGLLAVLQTMVIAQSTDSSLSASDSKAKIQPMYPPVEYRLESSKARIQPTDTIMRVNGLSSKPWVFLATQGQNQSVVHDASTHEPQLWLISFGHNPW